MMYHAESFANIGFETYIVGYRGTRYKAAFEPHNIDKVTCRFKTNTRFVVNTSRPVFLSPSAPAVLLASSFHNRRPHKDNTPSFSHLYNSPVHDPKHI